MSSLHVCYNCGRIEIAKTCRYCGDFAGEAVEVNGLEGLLMDMESLCDLYDDVLLFLHPDGSCHCVTMFPWGECQITPYDGVEAVEEDFIPFEFWPEGVVK